jgi:hypothetical protein
VDQLSLLNPVRLGTLVAQEAQGEVDAFDLAEPALSFGSGTVGIVDGKLTDEQRAAPQIILNDQE